MKIKMIIFQIFIFSFGHSYITHWDIFHQSFLRNYLIKDCEIFNNFVFSLKVLQPLMATAGVCELCSLLALFIKVRVFFNFRIQNLMFVLAFTKSLLAYQQIAMSSHILSFKHGCKIKGLYSRRKGT